MHKLMKVVQTADMPQEVFEFLLEGGSIVEDGFGKWTVGDMLAEAAKNPKRFKDTSDIKAVDDWMVQQGVDVGETVLLEH